MKHDFVVLYFIFFIFYLYFLYCVHGYEILEYQKCSYIHIICTKYGFNDAMIGKNLFKVDILWNNTDS
jgi:hypothetical protein